MPAPAISARSLVALGGAYWLLCLAALWLSRQPGSIATLWFANGLGIAVLAVYPRRHWGAMLLMIGLASFTANLIHGDPPGTALRFVPPNLIEVWLGAMLLRKARAFESMMASPIAFSRFLLFGALLPPLASATLAAVLLGGDELASFERVWIAWYCGAAIGTVAMLPLCAVLLRSRRRLDWQAPWRAENLLMAALVIGTTLLALLRLPYPYVYVTGVLTYVAVQAGFVMVATLSLLAIVAAGTLIAFGLFLPPPLSYQWEEALFYLPLLVSVIPPLVLSVAIARSGRRSQRALARSKAHYQRLYLRAPVMMHSLAADGRIVSVSNFWLDMMGYRRSEVLERAFTDFLTEPSRARAEQVILPMLRASGSCRDVELEMRRGDGKVRRMLMSATSERDEWGRVIGTLAALEDVTEKRQLESTLLAEHQRKVTEAEDVAARMSHLAQHDPLTGLPNRLLFFDRLQQALRSPRGTSKRLALIFIDLDYFKQINDTHGHLLGDELLRAIASRLSEQVRASDTVCRIGGDEFVVMVPALGHVEAAIDVAEKLMRSVSFPYNVGGREVRVTFSAGVAVAPDDGDSPERLIRHADDAMYRAKRQGRNQVVAYTAGE